MPGKHKNSEKRTTTVQRKRSTPADSDSRRHSALLSHEDQIVVAIRQIIRAVELHSRRLMEGHGLTGPQLALLREVGRRGPAAPKALAHAVHLSQATVTGILQRLERRGLLLRERSDADRRSVSIRISAKGKKLLAESPSLLQDRFRGSLAALDVGERLQILATLQRVAELMGAEGIDAAPHLTPGEIPAEESSQHGAMSR